MIHALVDGGVCDVLALSDRGLSYGDGLFETVATSRGRPCLWRAHLERLALGCRRLGIPYPDPAVLLAELVSLGAGDERAVVKILVTRGDGGRGYGPPADPRPRRVLIRHPWPAYPAAWGDLGVAAVYCRTPLALAPHLAGIKHLNRLEQVLARGEWHDPEIAEGLMCDTAGRVVCGTMSNLFVVTGGRLLTPGLDACGVAGTLRRTLMDEARALGVAVTESTLTRDDLARADGLLITNALIGVWPIRSLEGRAYPLDRLPWSLIERVRAVAATPDVPGMEA